MMSDVHHVHRGVMSLEAPLCDVDTSGSHGAFMNSLTPYPQLLLPNHSIGVPTMSWSGTTDPALVTIEKPPFSWQAESYNGGYSNNVGVGQMEMIAALNADSYNPELSQMVQLYSTLYQDQCGYSNVSFMDPVVDLSSECLQVVSLSGSGSDSLSTTETWRSETSGYDPVLMNESSSVTLVSDSNKNFGAMKIDQAVPTAQIDSWMHHTQLHGRSNSMHTDLHDVTSYDVLPVSSAPPTFKLPRTWDEALQQGDSLRYSLTSKTNLKLDCVLSNPLPRTSTRLATPYTRPRVDVQEEGSRFFINGKPAATSVEPQSVAARHRRKKISERIRVLEKLIPGGNKMDTATMLDEAIEYVKFLQLQVQILESDSLDDIPAAAASNHKRKFDGGEFSAANLRAATSPLILSEVLQQQLFKQKLCLVSIRQCPTYRPPPSLLQAVAPPSILRKK